MVPQQEFHDVHRDLTFLTTLIKASSPAAIIIREMTPLSPGYVPGPHDCICGRGKKSFYHIGNQRFRHMVSKHLPQYADATTKVEKSLLVSSIVDKIRDNSPHGGFVKFSESTGRWHEVGDHLAREKVGQAFRDSLHTKYRSSSAFKKEKKKTAAAIKAKKCKARHIDLSQSKKVILSKIRELSEVVARGEAEEVLADLFHKINSDLLREIKVMTKLGISQSSCESIVASCRNMRQVEEDVVQTCESLVASCSNMCRSEDDMDLRNDDFHNASQSSCASLVASCNKSQVEDAMDLR